MLTRKKIRPGETVPLKLTATERKLILDGLILLDDDYEKIVMDTPTGQPLMITLDDLEVFGGYIAAEANHCEDKKRQKKLDAILDKIQSLQDKYTDGKPPKTVTIEDARKEKLISDQVAQIAQFATQAVVAAEQLGIKKKSLDGFCLAPAQREVLTLVPGVTKAIKKKLTLDGSTFSIGEVASLTLALADDLPDKDARKQMALLLVAQHLIECLQGGIIAEAGPKLTKKPRRTSKATDALYQFKITLLDSNPPIWRRIQVQECTLDKFHEHIQMAMGWTNSHLHQFEIKGQLYGDPLLLEETFDEFQCLDSTTTLLSDIVPKTGRRLAFKYEYDFGDSWEHEVIFEGRPPNDPKAKYPLCLEGERACPPEDVGGVWGYQDFLAAIADPKHEEHESFLEWCGGTFSPEKFDPKKATREMKRGLPDWRSMEEDF